MYPARLRIWNDTDRINEFDLLFVAEQPTSIFAAD